MEVCSRKGGNEKISKIAEWLPNDELFVFAEAGFSLISYFVIFCWDSP